MALPLQRVPWPSPSCRFAERPAGAARAPRIAVIGAGISGLAAALRMQDSRLACTVYEADTRLGGRMFSNAATWASGQVSEWGGELIDTGHKTIQSLAKRFGLALDDLIAAEPNHSEPTFYFSGHYYPYKQATTDFKDVHNNIVRDMQSFTWPVTWNNPQPGAGTALSNLSLYDWIETRVPGGHSSPMGALLDVAYNEEFGGETTDQTALNLLGLLAFHPSPGQFSLYGASDERYHIRGGNGLLPKAIAAALPSGSIKTGWQLTALATNSDGTQTLTFTMNGSATTVTADHTILAVPLGVMQRLDFSRAKFDARKLGQIAAMRMGHNTKLHLQFRTRMWNSVGPWPGISNGDSYSDTGYVNTWDATRGAGRSGGHARQLHRRQRRLVVQPGGAVLRPEHELMSCRRRTHSSAGPNRSTPVCAARGTGARPSRPGTSTLTPTALTRTGRRVTATTTRATRRCVRATRTSPANTVRSTSRAIWKVAPPRASARPPR